MLALFLIGGGVYAVKHTPLDALPDLSDVQVIFRQAPKLATGHHFGSRLVFARDGDKSQWLGA